MKINFSNFEVELFTFGNFRLDGGAMFGNVPKNLWSKKLAGDAENCIPLTTRSLLIKKDNRQILVDVGMGDKWDEKSKTIYEINNTPLSELPFKPEDITDVILTHLHFDHAGGITKIGKNGLELTYPNANVYLQKANYENALQPNLRERASYLKDIVEPLKQAKLNLLTSAGQIMPNISASLANGHTKGLQVIYISDDHKTLVFPSDLIPTAHHTALPYIMGYDICAETVLQEKASFLESAEKNNWLVVFEHDRHNAYGRIGRDAKGNFSAIDLQAA